MIGLACLIGAILSALVLGLAVIVMDLRRDLVTRNAVVDRAQLDAAEAIRSIRESLPKKRIRRKAVVAS